MLSFTISANPDTHWRVRVVVHNTRKALHKAKVGDGGGTEDELAFCERFSHIKAINDKNGVFAEIHLCKGPSLKLAYIVHEVIHCLIGYFDMQRLKLIGATYDMEEHAAYTAEILVESILHVLKKHKYKVS